MSASRIPLPASRIPHPASPLPTSCISLPFPGSWIPLSSCCPPPSSPFTPPFPAPAPLQLLDHPPEPLPPSRLPHPPLPNLFPLFPSSCPAVWVRVSLIPARAPGALPSRSKPRSQPPGAAAPGRPWPQGCAQRARPLRLPSPARGRRRAHPGFIPGEPSPGTTGIRPGGDGLSRNPREHRHLGAAAGAIPENGRASFSLGLAAPDSLFPGGVCLETGWFGRLSPALP